MSKVWLGAVYKPFWVIPMCNCRSRYTVFAFANGGAARPADSEAEILDEISLSNSSYVWRLFNPPEITLLPEQIKDLPDQASGRYGVLMPCGITMPVYFVRNSPHSDRLFVFFNGAHDKNVKEPVFYRLTWASFIPGDALFVSDPLTLAHGDLGLGWYLGYNDLNLFTQIAAIARQFASRFAYAHLYSYGSSGGGFASLKIAEYLPINAMALNPQLFCDRYFSFADYLKQTGNTCTEEFKARIRIKIAETSNYLIMQNIFDGHHMQCHFLPFARELRLPIHSGFSNYNNLSLFLFRNILGHAGFDNKHILRMAISLWDLFLDGKIDALTANELFTPLGELWNSVGLLSLRESDG